MAGATGDARIVQLLLERGADPARGNAHGWTPLHQAAYSGRVDLAEMLIDAGAPTDAYARGDGGTPLVIALFWGHPVPPRWSTGSGSRRATCASPPGSG